MNSLPPLCHNVPLLGHNSTLLVTMHPPVDRLLPLSPESGHSDMFGKVPLFTHIKLSKSHRQNEETSCRLEKIVVNGIFEKRTVA